MAIRVLQQKELVIVTGASGGYDPACAGASAKASQHGNRSNNNSASNAGKGYYASLGNDVTNCNNGIIGGMMAGAAGGLGD